MNAFLVGKDDVLRAHPAFLGVEPTERQKAIYAGFPLFRGVSTASQDAEIFDSVVIMSLVQAFTMKRTPEPHRVHMFVAPRHRAWAVQRLQEFTRIVFGKLKERKDVQRAPGIGKLFHAILMGSKVLQFEQAPERWSCFGFLKIDPVPSWMKNGLQTLDT